MPSPAKNAVTTQLPDVHRAFAASLREAREAVGLSQAQLSERLREIDVAMPTMTLYRTERATRPVRLDEAIALAFVLDVAVGPVVGETVRGDAAAPVDEAAFLDEQGPWPARRRRQETRGRAGRSHDPERPRYVPGRAEARDPVALDRGRGTGERKDEVRFPDISHHHARRDVLVVGVVDQGDLDRRGAAPQTTADWRPVSIPAPRRQARSRPTTARRPSSISSCTKPPLLAVSRVLLPSLRVSRLPQRISST